MSESIHENLPHLEIHVEETVSLRQIRIDEAPTIYRLVDLNREYLRQYLPWVDGTNSVQDSENFIANTLHKRAEGSEYGYGIIVNGEPAGHMSLMHINDGEEPEIGYWIASKMSGRGISTRACRSLIDFGFKELGLKEIIIKADPENIGSNRIAQKLGAVLTRQEYDPRIGEVNANVWAIE